LTVVAALHRLLIAPERSNKGDTHNNNDINNIQIHFVGTKIILEAYSIAHPTEETKGNFVYCSTLNSTKQAFHKKDPLVQKASGERNCYNTCIPNRIESNRDETRQESTAAPELDC
jgi:hypothetical protein